MSSYSIIVYDIKLPYRMLLELTFIFCVVFCKLFFVLLAIVLSVLLWFMTSDYTFVIFKPFFLISLFKDFLSLHWVHLAESPESKTPFIRYDTMTTDAGMLYVSYPQYRPPYLFHDKVSQFIQGFSGVCLVHVIKLHVITFLVPCCDVCYNFPMKTIVCTIICCVYVICIHLC